MTTTAVNQQSIDIIHQFTDDVWNGRDYDRIDELVTDNFVQHGPVTGMEIHGAEELTQNIRQYHEAFSDLESTLNLVFSDESGEYVCAHVTNTGTHDGELMGISATDVEGTVNVTGIYRIEDGRVAESWIVADMYTLFNLLGTQPDMGPFAA